MSRKLLSLPGGRDSAPAFPHDAMDVTAANAFDRWLPLDECPEQFTPEKVIIVRRKGPDASRWLLHEEECWLPQTMRGRLVEPPEDAFVQGSPGLILDRLS